MEEIIAELFSSLEEIMQMDDEQFSAAYPIILETFRRQMKGLAGEEAIRRTLATFRAMGYSKEQGKAEGEGLKQICQQFIIEDLKKKYLMKEKQEFLDIFSEMFYNYIDQIQVMWEREIPFVGVQLLREGAELPTYANNGDQGADIYACEDTIVPANSFGTIIKTGLAVAIPYGWALAVRPRSGMSCKTQVRISNSPGTIDTNYKDEVGVIIDNFSSEPYVIHKGDRIAQLILEKNYQASFIEVEDVRELGEDRGGGYGSTGE